MTTRSCKACGARPAAVIGTHYCFECWPGGPASPPPCLRCGSTNRYWSAGLCENCHPHRPFPARSCRDCLAWGVHRGRTCRGCESWSAKYAVGNCTTCGRTVAVGTGGACRLCTKQRTRVLRLTSRSPSLVSLELANRGGQQLFFADMFMASSARTEPRTARVRPERMAICPVTHRQLVLFETVPDLKLGMERGFPPPRDPALAAALFEVVRDFAAVHGWSRPVIERAQRGVRILLGLQHTPGAPIKASDVALLSTIRISVRGVAEVLASVDLLEDDRVPAAVRWFPVQVAELPEPMRTELAVWFDVWRNGSTTPPRFRPREDKTVSSQLRAAMPALQQWAKTHVSLREIAREDVYAVLPPAGGARASMLQGLRSIFRVLKARRLVFVNPTARMSVPKPDAPVPSPIDLTALRAALDSTDSTRAVLAALLAFHAVRVWQLRELQLTDVRDGRLFLDDHVVLLAAPARQRLDTYLAERSARWPATANAHLFIHYRNANTTSAVTPWWIRRRLGMSSQSIRQDRILDEAHASAGDIRLLCDLFGLSPTTASRYAAGVSQLDRDARAEPID